MTTRWNKLLNHWIDAEFRHSLTFAFLIGSLRDPVGSNHSNESDPRVELEKLVSEIANVTHEGVLFHVYRCPDLDKLVLARINSESAPPKALPIPASTGGHPILYVSDVAAPKSGLSAKNLADAIWRESGDAIVAGRFSCRGRTFQQFSSEDLAMIRNALS